jgi:hypothetical protein
VKEKERTSSAVKCDDNLVRMVQERIEHRFPNLAFTRKSSIEFALMEWIENRDRTEVVVGLSNNGVPRAGDVGR